MPINIDSTDSEEAVAAAIGGEVQEETVEEKPAPEEEIQEGETDDNSEGQEEETQEEVQEAAQERPKKNGFKKRIDKLTSKVSQMEQEKEYWRQLALKTQTPAEQSPAKPVTGAKPKADDFESHDEYVEALTDWKLEQKLSEKESKQKEQVQKTEFEKRLEKFNERTAAFAEAHEDFDDVVNSVKAPLPALVQEAILDSDLAPELLYELAQNEEERKRICDMPQAKAVMELGKIEARLGKKSETKTTKAPPPVTPVRTRTSGQHKTIYDEDLSQREYERLRAEQLKQRGA